jgi:NADH-quinone oxidoreductase subunit C
MSEAVRQILAEKFPELTFYTKAIGLVAEIPVHKLREVAAFCRDDERLSCDFLHNMAGADFPPDRMEVFLMLFSYKHKHRVTLKITINRKSPTCQSVAAIWPSADWYEREIYDLFGITFIGHPDMRRLFMPEYWEGYPLRKDYTDSRIVPLTEISSE